MKSEIKISVELDENKVPEKLSWSAVDGGVENQETKAALLSLWDDKQREALRIDLWTKDMPMDHMKIFFTKYLELWQIPTSAQPMRKKWQRRLENLQRTMPVRRKLNKI